jgi:hypothetical protein
VDELEADAERTGGSPLAVKLGTLLNDLSFNVSADRRWVREAIEKGDDLGVLLTNMYRAFYAVVSKLAESEAARMGGSGQLSQNDLQASRHFTVVCTFSYRGFQFLEWLWSPDSWDQFKEALERLLQSKKESSADE